MKIDQYETEPQAIDDTPRPRASQDIAAAKRAGVHPGKSTHDTEPIAPVTPAHKSIPPLIIGVIGVLSVAGVLALAFSQHGTLPQPLVIEQPTAILTPAASPSPQASPAPTSAPTALPATINAYAAPDGQLLGPIELDREIVAVAHYGSSWIQADVHGSGRVWLRARDVPDIALTGPDLAPAAQTGRGLTLATPEPPEATPEPLTATPAPTAVPIVDAPLRVRAEDDCSAEHGRCDPPCTAEHGRCSAGDK